MVWAKQNPDKLQQNFLMSFPVIAEKSAVTVDLLAGFFREQFVVNFDDDPKRWWQVFDRTTGEEVPKAAWSFDAKRGTVTIRGAAKWHKYTVNFLAFRIWEEISMYNHITNGWGDREHLAAVDPMHPETRKHLKRWFDQWLRDHPDTDVVRFTSMFYNFTWFWGDDLNRRYLETGRLMLEKLGRGYAWLDTGTHESLVEASNYVETIERRQGLKVCCPEEIAYAQGWIDAEQVLRLAAPLAKNGYGQYLRGLVAQERLP